MRKLFEGAQQGDLDYLISKKIHFDEYDSKMGRPESIITASFKIKQKEPAKDLVSFLENGYDWVLDADVSTGEINDGEYLVFLEMQRRPDMTEKIMEMLKDMQHLTNIKPSDWQFKWYKQHDYQPLKIESLNETVPKTANEYKQMTGSFNEVKEGSKGLLPDIADLKRLSGIK
jgi:hypothetical protein